MRAKRAGGRAEEVGGWGKGREAKWGMGGRPWRESAGRGGGGRRAGHGEPASRESGSEEMAAGRAPAVSSPPTWLKPAHPFSRPSPNP